MKRSHALKPPGNRFQIPNVYSMNEYYDEEEDYHFAEAHEVEEIEEGWFAASRGESYSKGLPESQRKSVKWRVQVLRVLVIVSMMIALAAGLPAWIMLLNSNRISLKNERKVQECNSIAPDSEDADACVYYVHELSTFTAFVGLWIIGTIVQQIFMIFSSWRLHQKSFTGVVSLWNVIFMIIGVAVAVFALVELCLFHEDFNWRIAGVAYRESHRGAELKLELKGSASTIIAAIGIITILKALWMFFMRQIMQYNLVLHEFGSEICGGKSTNGDTELTTQDNSFEPEDDNGISIDDDDDDGMDGERSFSMRGESIFDELEQEELENAPKQRHIASDSSQSTLSQVMQMMSTLTTTMTALSSKIDAIEARVGDGSALIVMPPGENKWDAQKN